MEEKKAIIIIPAYEPDIRLADFVGDLMDNGFFNIIVVDDGSGIRYRDVFSRISERSVSDIVYIG